MSKVSRRALEKRSQSHSGITKSQRLTDDHAIHLQSANADHTDTSSYSSAR
jgi:hypothetical protein